MHSPSGSKREKITPHSCMSALNPRQIFTHLMNKINNLLFNVLEADSLHTELPIFTPVTQLGCKLVFIYLFF